MKPTYVFLGEGFEDIEALAPVDIMRRCGMDVKTVSVTADKTVKSAHGVPVVADLSIEDPSVDFSQAEWLVCPGGMPGALNLYNCEKLNELLVNQSKTGKVAAICASPAVVLAPLGILKGRTATCYPGCEQPCIEGGAEMVNKRVVALDNLITGNGPGSAMAFGYALAANSCGEKVARQCAEAMIATNQYPD